MTDKTLQQRLRDREGDNDDDLIDAAADALDAQAATIAQLKEEQRSSEAILFAKIDAKEARIKALEGALRDTAMMLEHAITGRNGERYGFIETRSGSMMHAQGVVEKLHALLKKK